MYNSWIGHGNICVVYVGFVLCYYLVVVVYRSIDQMHAILFLPVLSFFVYLKLFLLFTLHFFLMKFLLQPMLCVTAVNPFLLSKVPALLHIMSVRKKIGTMLPYVRCPFRRSINRGLGNRRYLLESNDFFALRDLIDLSRGVFAGQLLFLAYCFFVP